MSTESAFDRFVFPVLDWLQIESLRHPCTQLSAGVRSLTGYWVHPALWEVLGVLLAMLGVSLIAMRRKRIAALAQAAGR